MGQDRDVRDAPPVTPSTEVLPGKNGMNPRYATSARRVHADYSGMCQVTTQHGSPQCAGQSHICAVFGASRDFILALHSGNALTYDRERSHLLLILSLGF